MIEAILVIFGLAILGASIWVLEAGRPGDPPSEKKDFDA